MDEYGNKGFILELYVKKVCIVVICFVIFWVELKIDWFN